MKLNNKVILVTGAGQGIGREVSIAFAKEGATVILLGRKVKKLEKLYDEIIGLGLPEPVIFPMNLIDATQQEFKDMAFAIKQQLGSLDGIVHNATDFYSLTELRHQTAEQWQTLMKVNLIAPFAINQACLPILNESNDASIILTNESHSKDAHAYWGGFAISKNALVQYMNMQVEEWESFYKIRINMITPGPVHSPQRAKTHPAEDKDQLPIIETLLSQYIYLMSEESKSITGQVFQIHT